MTFTIAWSSPLSSRQELVCVKNKKKTMTQTKKRDVILYIMAWINEATAENPHEIPQCQF